MREISDCSFLSCTGARVSVAVACAVLLAVSGVSVTRADVPTRILYEGSLFDGNKPADGPFDVVFNVYASRSGGEALAGLDVSPVSVTDGRFTAEVAR